MIGESWDGFSSILDKQIHASEASAVRDQDGEKKKKSGMHLPLKRGLATKRKQCKVKVKALH